MRRSVQAHLALSETAQHLGHDADPEWRDKERMGGPRRERLQRAGAEQEPRAVPLAWKALVDTGGGNVVAGLRNAVSDLSKAPRVRTMVDPDAFEVVRRLSQPRWAAWFATEPAQRHTPRVFAVCRCAGSAHRCRMPPAGRRTHDQVKVDPRHRWILG